VAEFISASTNKNDNTDAPWASALSSGALADYISVYAF
jgi:hypothetical protein